MAVSPLQTLIIHGFLFFVFFISLSNSSSPLLIPLTHSLLKNSPATPISTHQLLKLSSLRSSSRFNSLKIHHHHHRLNKPVSLPLAAGSDYTLPLTVGHPPRTLHLYLDTASDIVWTPCHSENSKFKCILCENKPRSPFPPLVLSPSLSAVPCSSSACSAAHTGAASSDLCVIAGCDLERLELSTCVNPCPRFYYAYGDGSLTARLFSDQLRLSDGLSLHNFTFGCASTTYGEPVGVAGFGRGVLSLPGQVAARRFSYCLSPHRFSTNSEERELKPSTLILHRRPPPESGTTVYTPIIHNSHRQYYYYVGLEGVFVGEKYIPAPDNLREVDSSGNGGVVVDSGTTFTTFPAKYFRQVKAEFEREMKGHRRAANVEAQSGVGPCYYVAGDEKVPGFRLAFRGNATVDLLTGSYFMNFPTGAPPDEKKPATAACLMLMGSSDEDDDDGGGPAAVLGNFQQQDMEVIYDLERGRIGFSRRDCASLWEESTKHV